MIYGPTDQETIELQLDTENNQIYVLMDKKIIQTIKHVNVNEKKTKEIQDIIEKINKPINAQDLFKDHNKIKEGEWSKHGFLFTYNNNKTIKELIREHQKQIKTKDNKFIEIGLYHEPYGSGEYSWNSLLAEKPEKDLTLHIFVNDEIFFCWSIWYKENKKKDNWQEELKELKKDIWEGGTK